MLRWLVRVVNSKDQLARAKQSLYKPRNHQCSNIETKADAQS